ncbi:hypothetical protein RFI_27692 [Reticulomyxa filosa]|uniref:Uncharacterized protein n=1 Tax=Reticulomyxa filosa TaxID=46433 RepID=X6M892_RETFI|nr:hypothetical protein RFI_27692 [Reticulomyxa filosa]|eukprot:ETO09687.1 hypothetical protein RFI_27692 [Reticulomyxa filosa]
MDGLCIHAMNAVEVKKNYNTGVERMLHVLMNHKIGLDGLTSCIEKVRLMAFSKTRDDVDDEWEGARRMDDNHADNDAVTSMRRAVLLYLKILESITIQRKSTQMGEVSSNEMTLEWVKKLLTVLEDDNNNNSDMKDATVLDRTLDFGNEQDFSRLHVYHQRFVVYAVKIFSEFLLLCCSSNPSNSDVIQFVLQFLLHSLLKPCHCQTDNTPASAWMWIHITYFLSFFFF